MYTNKRKGKLVLLHRIKTKNEVPITKCEGSKSLSLITWLASQISPPGLENFCVCGPKRVELESTLAVEFV